MLDERSGGLADQCGEDALVGVLADAVAARQEQAVPSDLDPAVDVDIGSEIRDPPGAGARGDASHDVELDVRERAVRVHRPSAVRHRDDADAPFESRQKFTLT